MGAYGCETRLYVCMYVYVYVCNICAPYIHVHMHIICRLLKWEPTPMEEWLRDTLVWYDTPENAAYTMAYALKR